MILVVDDSKDLRVLLEMVLKEDFSVVTAGNGKEALEIIECSKLPELIFLDSKMDIMDGNEFLQALEQKCSSQQPAVVVMSGSDQPLKSTLIVATLKKPADVDTIRALAKRYAQLR